jgi:hypothetical protein
MLPSRDRCAEEGEFASYGSENVTCDLKGTVYRFFPFYRIERFCFPMTWLAPSLCTLGVCNVGFDTPFVFAVDHPCGTVSFHDTNLFISFVSHLTRNNYHFTPQRLRRRLRRQRPLKTLTYRRTVFPPRDRCAEEGE